MKRRQFLTMLGTLPVANAASEAYAGNATQAAITEPGLATFLGSPDFIRRLGQTYRKHFTAEDDYMVLVEAVLHSCPHGHALTDFLETRIAQDFADGDTVLLDGWLLSRTEARQTALYSLIHT